VSGALFVAIGLLFLMTDGTANLGGFMGVDSQYDLQVWLERVADAVSDAAVLLVVVLMAIAWLVARKVRRRRRGTTPTPNEHEVTTPVDSGPA
jgi:hypothetical protein